MQTHCIGSAETVFSQVLVHANRRNLLILKNEPHDLTAFLTSHRRRSGFGVCRQLGSGAGLYRGLGFGAAGAWCLWACRYRECATAALDVRTAHAGGAARHHGAASPAPVHVGATRPCQELAQALCTLQRLRAASLFPA